MVLAAAGDNQRIEVKRMDQTVYSQVMITCTTINVIIIISTITMWVGIMIHDRREKKKKEREEQAAKKEEAAQ